MKNAVFTGSISEVHLAEHSIVLELDNGQKLLIEGDASYCYAEGSYVPLKSVVSNLCGAFVTGIFETDSGGLSVSIRSGETIYVSVQGFDDGGDGPYTLLP